MFCSESETEKRTPLPRWPLQRWGHGGRGPLCPHAPLHLGAPPARPETRPKDTPARAPPDPACTCNLGDLAKGALPTTCPLKTNTEMDFSLQARRATPWGLQLCCCLFSEADQINFTAVENHANIVEKEAFNSLLLWNAAQQQPGTDAAPCLSALPPYSTSRC